MRLVTAGGTKEEEEDEVPKPLPAAACGCGLRDIISLVNTDQERNGILK